MSHKGLKRMALALEDLEPALWGTLTPCLLDLIFLRLPVVQINQLRLLSKLWKVAIDSVESHFNLLLEDKVYPNLFGLIGNESQWYKPYVWIFDVNQDQWCVREIDRSVDGKFIVHAADGGLICFVSVTRTDPLTIVVMNPLTRKKFELPRLLYIYNGLPTIQLKVNRKNNQYKVFCVDYMQSGNRSLLAQVYDSQTKEWSIVGSREQSWGYISGYWYGRNIHFNCDNRQRLGPCLYDFAEGQLYQYEVYNLKECLTLDYAILWDRLIVLHMHKEKCGLPSDLIKKGPKHKYFISEYHLQQNSIVQVEGGTHGCKPFGDSPKENHTFYLHACNGYLVIGRKRHKPIYEDMHLWLYNLSTYKWHVLPNLPGFNHKFFDEENLMCELRWSAIP